MTCNDKDLPWLNDQIKSSVLLSTRIKYLRSASHCVKYVQIRSYFWSEYRKIRTRNNSVFGHFSRSVKDRRTNSVYENLRSITWDQTEAITAQKMFTMNILLISLMTLIHHQKYTGQ